MTSSTSRRVTAVDIAREVGVSRTTVGFVLNSTPGQTISEETRRKVLEAARRLGYRPHLAAKALASGRSRIVLLVLPDWPMEFSMRQHVEQASAVLDRAGYSLVTMTPSTEGAARPLWETLQPDVVMGLLPFSAEQYAAISASGAAAIIPPPDESGALGSLNYNDGPRLQVEHLLERGHRRLAFASPPDPRVAELARARKEAAAEAVREHGVRELEEATVDLGNAKERVAAWSRQGVTGVIAYNDDIAALVVGAALRLGLDVPRDLAVVGHDDSPIAKVFVPSLSTVHADEEGMGRVLAQQALDAAVGVPSQLLKPRREAELVQRESS